MPESGIQKSERSAQLPRILLLAANENSGKNISGPTKLDC
uniref:Uncharacterized protein n=1 Tax=Arundo donax TaxID=35708 RepID=A0A0A8Y5X3_ARUDO